MTSDGFSLACRCLSAIDTRMQLPGTAPERPPLTSMFGIATELAARETPENLSALVFRISANGAVELQQVSAARLVLPPLARAFQRHWRTGRLVCFFYTHEQPRPHVLVLDCQAVGRWLQRLCGLCLPSASDSPTDGWTVDEQLRSLCRNRSSVHQWKIIQGLTGACALNPAYYAHTLAPGPPAHAHGCQLVSSINSLCASTWAMCLTHQRHFPFHAALDRAVMPDDRCLARGFTAQEAKAAATALLSTPEARSSRSLGAIGPSCPKDPSCPTDKTNQTRRPHAPPPRADVANTDDLLFLSVRRERVLSAPGEWLASRCAPDHPSLAVLVLWRHDKTLEVVHTALSPHGLKLPEVQKMMRATLGEYCHDHQYTLRVTGRFPLHHPAKDQYQRWWADVESRSLEIASDR